MKRNRFASAVPLALAVLIPVLSINALADQGSAGLTGRWESNITAGVVLKDNKTIGLVKSFWWYPVPRTIALGLSFDYVGNNTLPLSINVSFCAPTPVIAPFARAGAGASLSTGGVTHFGGGLMAHLSSKLGLIAEYRRYFYKTASSPFTGASERQRANYFGAGICYYY